MGEHTDGIRYNAVAAQIGRVVVGRMLPGSDILKGIAQVCDDHGIRYAAVDFAYGSFARAHYKVLALPAGAPRPELVDRRIDEPVEFLGGFGLVCENERGERDIHFHGVIGDQRERVGGGHFVAGGNPIYNNLDFLVLELKGVRLLRRWDEETQTVELVVEPDPGAAEG